MAKSKKKLAKIGAAALLGLALPFTLAGCNTDSNVDTDAAQDTNISMNWGDFFASQQEEISNLESKICELEQVIASQNEESQENTENTETSETNENTEDTETTKETTDISVTYQAIKDTRDLLLDVEKSLQTDVEDLDGYATINALSDLEYQIETMKIAEIISDEQAETLTNSCVSLEKSVVFVKVSQGIEKTCGGEALIETGSLTTDGVTNLLTAGVVFGEAVGSSVISKNEASYRTEIKNEEGTVDTRTANGDYYEEGTNADQSNFDQNYGISSLKSDVKTLLEGSENVSCTNISCTKDEEGVSYSFDVVYSYEDTDEGVEHYSFDVNEEGFLTRQSYSYENNTDIINFENASAEEAWKVIDNVTAGLDNVKQAQNAKATSSDSRVK